jgi:hypothetical protein
LPVTFVRHTDVLAGISASHKIGLHLQSPAVSSRTGESSDIEFEAMIRRSLITRHSEALTTAGKWAFDVRTCRGPWRPGRSKRQNPHPDPGRLESAESVTVCKILETTKKLIS